MVESKLVELVVAGSNPVGHPKTSPPVLYSGLLDTRNDPAGCTAFLRVSLGMTGWAWCSGYWWDWGGQGAVYGAKWLEMGRKARTPGE